ncbi:MAG TPA: GNAT family N-acetyltransferase [Thermoanaerobaculia bacterium]|jgi:hypothetical protein
MPEKEDVPIENHEAAHRFEARFPRGTAFLKYHYDPAGRIHLDHTEVPVPLRHHGIAALLAEAALDFAKRRNLRVVPVCPYVIEYLDRHPERSLLVDRDAIS